MRIALLLALLGCSESPTYQWRIITLPDGSAGAAVHCPVDLGVCYDRAARACSPHRYEVIDKDGRTIVEGAGYGRRWSMDSRYSGTLIVRCR